MPIKIWVATLFSQMDFKILGVAQGITNYILLSIHPKNNNYTLPNHA